jgi:LCP family protein required for cell wall assembly
VTNRSRLVAGVTAAVVLLAAGIFVTFRIAVESLNNAIPQADLFGVEFPGSPQPGSTSSAPQPEPTTPEGSDIHGPINILIAGEDTRWEVPGWPPHSDTVLVMHINADLTHAYIASLPRDLLVHVPAFGPSGSGADYTKLTHAMTYGAKIPGTNSFDTAQGFQLLAQTVSGYTGLNFDAGALVSFTGLERLIDAIGGIDIYVDQYVQSIHMQPNGLSRIWCDHCEHQYDGPQATYNVGMQHMIGWQVLDYSRQRYGLPYGAYDRERHQRQIVKAMIAKIFSFELMTHPFVAAYVLLVAGSALTLDLRGRTVDGYAYALRNLRPENVTLVGLPGSGVGGGGAYLGEALSPIGASYFEAARNDTVGDFLAANPSLVEDPR